jgi:squalene-hopene/tetraprenyl-beta-curcumene cyclase
MKAPAMDLGPSSPVPRPHYPLSSASASDSPSEIHAEQSAAIAATRDWLLARQDSTGFWCGELEGDTILESEYLLLLAWLRQERSPRARKAAEYLRRQQLPDGGWAMYPGGKLEISGSVKAYFALKLTGHDPQAEYMRRARAAIREAGGADAVNSFTRFYLALLGQISYDRCPAVPPELILLPGWSPINIYRMSAWSRTIVVPLAIMWAHRPVRKLPAELGISELFINEEKDWPPLRCPGLADELGWLSWDNFFRQTDRGLKWLEKRRIRPLRRQALAAAREWMTTRFAHSDGLGAIFPPIVWSIVALKCLGYRDDSVELRYNFDQLDALLIEESETARLQPCLSPVWDTTITLRALAESGLSLDDAPIGAAVDWLLDKEVTRPGDWSHNVASPPGGWYFEHHNEFYPDVDDTAMALLALRAVRDRSQHVGIKVEDSGEFNAAGLAALARFPQNLLKAPLPPQLRRQRTGRDDPALVSRVRGLNSACERARRWMLAMQNRDGGWGAFDKDNDSAFLCRVPFADHNAMIDPSTPDLTARVLESLAAWGARLGEPAVDRAVAYLRKTQEQDGSWFGRWGVNYIYGTWQSLVGLTAVGVPTDDPAVRRGANWLLACQQACGGWGESADTYEQPELRGQGPCTPSQTAWALLGLWSAGYRTQTPIERGVRYLIETQNPDGSWDEPEFTGTGFPRVFYLRYHYYPIYFPLLALATIQPGAAESQHPKVRRHVAGNLPAQA